MNRFFACVLLFLIILVGGACGPLQKETRIDGELGSDGYALFRAHQHGGQRLAFLVELRDAPSGSYVLLHSRKAPPSVGWFDLDLTDFTACKRYGEEATDRTELGCVLPDGHGDLVDVVHVSEPRNAVLRHEIVAPPSASGAADSTMGATLDGYYAVMRVERDGTSVHVAAEVRVIDDLSSSSSPSVEWIE